MSSIGGVIGGCPLIWHNDRRSRDDILVLGNFYVGELSASYISTCTVIVRHDQSGDALRFHIDVPLFKCWECFGRSAGQWKAVYPGCETIVQNVHGGNRLTPANQEITDITRTKMIECVWVPKQISWSKMDSSVARYLINSGCNMRRP